MIKPAKRSVDVKAKNTYTGLGVLFVIIWPILVMMIARAGWLDGVVAGMDTENANVIVSILLLVPIAVVVFPLLYRMGNIYSLNEGESTPPAWRRILTATVGTSVVLGIVLYLFQVIGFALFYRF